MRHMNTALTLSVRGWRLFPITPNSKIPLRGWTDWEGRSTDDPDEIMRIWSETPHANVGVATGPSRLLVVDFDAAKEPQTKSGIENFRERYPDKKLPATYTVHTGSGGWHLYYRLPEYLTVRNTAGKLAEKVDTRAQGGYVVASGSTVNALAYKTTNDRDPAGAPEWLLTELEDKPTLRQDIKPKGNSTQYALAALRRECEALAGMAEGGRNHQANRAAWNMSRFVVKGELDEARAWADILGAAYDCGLTDPEASNAVRSGMNRGIEHYRGK